MFFICLGHVGFYLYTVCWLRSWLQATKLAYSELLSAHKIIAHRHCHHQLGHHHCFAESWMCPKQTLWCNGWLLHSYLLQPAHRCHHSEDVWWLSCKYFKECYNERNLTRAHQEMRQRTWTFYYDIVHVVQSTIDSRINSGRVHIYCKHHYKKASQR